VILTVVIEAKLLTFMLVGIPVGVTEAVAVNVIIVEIVGVRE